MYKRYKREEHGQSPTAWRFLQWLVIKIWRWVPTRRRVAWWYCRSLMRSYGIRVKPVRATGTPGAAVPTFDLRVYNPMRWQRDSGPEVAALGPIAWLPPGTEAHRVIHRRNLRRLRRIHHLEDVQAFHPDIITRAGDLVRLAATGVVVHLADGDATLRPLLGADLCRLMTTDVRGMAADARELLSIRMRRAALRDHSSWAHARQHGAMELPRVSILLAIRRPQFLSYALDSVTRQTYPHLELVLALHGAGFGDVRQQIAGLPCPAKVLQVSAGEPLGAVLNAAVEASDGTLLTKMDDDDVYGADHVWDLVLAHAYSGAPLVGKYHEFVYLAASDQTIYRCNGGNERYQTSGLAGGTLLISRHDLARAGGWRRVPRHVDEALRKDVVQAGGCIYRIHGAGFMLVRHGHRHTWEVWDNYFLAEADQANPGWHPGWAGIEDLKLPHPFLGRARTERAEFAAESPVQLAQRRSSHEVET